MEVDESSGNVHARPRDCVKQMSFVMDEHGSQTHPRQSTTRVSTKSKAPSPPGPDKLNSPELAQWFPGNPPALTMDHKENLTDKELSLTVVLPGGVEKMTTVHSSKPLMDLLVTLCAKYHLNPSGHTLELVTTNRNNIKLKPNALIGTLDAEKIIIKPKGEDKNKKAGPQMPEATVRMVINYKQTQKTILRVNPRVPLAELLPAICEKCEFEMESTVLLKDVKSLAPLDLSASLNDYAIREVYARDAQVPGSPVCPASPAYSGLVTPGKDKNQKEEENKGLFSMFRRSKKSKPEKATTVSAPSSPVLPQSRPRPHSMALPSTHASPFGSDAPKKRRAPQPPILVSQQSCPSGFSPRQRLYSEPCTRLDSTDQTPVLSRGSSTNSSLKRTKRKAPPPPSPTSAVAPEAFSPDDLQVSPPVTTLEEIKEQEETHSSASTVPDQTTHNTSPDVTLQTPPTETAIGTSTQENGEDLSSDGSNGRPHSQVNHSDTALELDQVDAEDLTQLADTSEPSTSEDLPSASVQVDDDTLPSAARLLPPSPPPPQVQDAETQASSPLPPPLLTPPPPPACLDSTSPGEHTDPGATSQPSLSTATQTTGEDAQVQTDLTSLPAQQQQQQQQRVPHNAPSSPSPSESGKKDMATLTDDLEGTLNPDASPPPAKVPPPPKLESKPKPSNELTRDYVPKVGMTTYTIVPQKSLDKLRYFEVALTLEAPPPDLQENHQGNATSPIEKQTEQSDNVDVEKRDATSVTQGTVNGSIQNTTTTTTNSVSSSASTTTTSTTTATTPTTDSQAGSPAEVKEIKIPPATKPKPGSFRLQQHKKTLGYYVTSAVEKSQQIASSTNEKQGNGNTKEKESLPPPPLPPVQSPVEPADGANVPGPKHEHKEPAVTRQSRVQPSLGLSLEKLRSFAAPRPYSPATPSKFAQAVSSAVKMSLSGSPRSPRSPTLSPSFSPTRSPSFSPARSPSFSPARSPSFSPVKRQSPPLGSKEKVEETEELTENNSTLQHVPHAPLFSGIVEVEGETNL
ncbi:cordon-bleu protein-like 1b isoform X1 [Eucyclogobius newberryi]|uniref:cordon-bleu protein-like 1b isoform X1 n=1 Tax=Eucyclogobius newberryi TaxID=166745 RepID=UPI003B5A078B